MSFFYKLIYHLQKRFYRWEKKHHNQFIQNKIISEGGEIGKGCRFGNHVNITGRKHIRFGNNIHIGSGSFIRAGGGLVIDDNTIISRNLLLYSLSHDYQNTLLPFDHNFIKRPVSIGKNVWIGMNVVICPGTVIGDGAVIGMGTVVHGHVPPLSIIGNPGWKQIGERDKVHYKKLHQSKSFAKEDGLPLYPISKLSE